MRRHWMYALLNILGLSVGFLVAFFILLWIQDERSFNSHYLDGDRVHRVMRTSSYGDGQVFTWPAITAKLDAVLDEEYPEIDRATLVTWVEDMAFRRDNVTFREKGIHAGPDFFGILSHTFLAGDPDTALDRPDAVALSESLARKYFPEEFEQGTSEMGAARVLGQSLVLENRQDLVITGVVRDIPQQASLRPDFVISLEEFLQRNGWVDDWGNNGLRMYVMLSPEARAAEVSAKIRNILHAHTDSDTDILFLQPLEDIYLRSSYENGVLVGGRIDYLRIFGVVGFFVLLIAAINFTNLATARSAQRALEVGVRKSLGGSRFGIAGQFMAESVLTAVAALVLAVLAVFLLTPTFNAITGKAIAIGSVSPGTWTLFALLALVTGMAAGLYPAAYLSSMPLIGIFRGSNRSGTGGAVLRRGLVVFQFALSVLLIIGAGTVTHQLDYIRSKALGLDRQDVFYSALEGPLAEQFDAFRDRLLEQPSIQSVASGGNTPLSIGSSTAWGVKWDGRDQDDNTLFSILTTGYDYVRTMKMTMAAGRPFSRTFALDSLNILVNEAAARAMGFDEPVGETVTVWGRTGAIVGVVSDFHFSSMYEPIEPLVFRLDPEDTDFVFVRPAPGQTAEALASFQAAFEEFNPLNPYEVSFLDDQFEQSYRSEAVIATLARIFTIFAILVACLGLFGLASFSAERRTKEIGTRKVLGASVSRVVGMLAKEFVALVLLGFVLAGPIGWWFSQRWLAEFEYHNQPGWQLYAWAALLLSGIAFATVSYQSLRAAMANPSESLRTE